MIIGLGSDLCNIERIQASLDRFGDRVEIIAEKEGVNLFAVATREA